MALIPQFRHDKKVSTLFILWKYKTASIFRLCLLHF